MFGNRASRTDRIDTLISAGTRFEGNLAFSGGLRIDGEVKGNVIAAPGQPSVLVVGEHGRVQGEVRAERMIVCGVVCGSIFASELLELKSRARISGELRYGALEVHAGAVLEVELKREAPTAVPVPAALLAAPLAKPQPVDRVPEPALPLPSQA